MAELVGSIVGIIAVGTRVSLSLFNIYGTLATAPTEIKGLLNGISTLCCVLQQLNYRLLNRFHENLPFTEDMEKSFVAALCDCSETMTALEKHLEGLNEGDSVRDKVRWIYKSAEIGRIQSLLDSNKQNLSLALDMLNVMASAGATEKLEHIHSEITTIRETMTRKEIRSSSPLSYSSMMVHPSKTPELDNSRHAVMRWLDDGRPYAISTMSNSPSPPIPFGSGNFHVGMTCTHSVKSSPSPTPAFSSETIHIDMTYTRSVKSTPSPAPAATSENLHFGMTYTGSFMSQYEPTQRVFYQPKDAHEDMSGPKDSVTTVIQSRRETLDSTEQNKNEWVVEANIVKDDGENLSSLILGEILQLQSRETIDLPSNCKQLESQYHLDYNKKPGSIDDLAKDLQGLMDSAFDELAEVDLQLFVPTEISTQAKVVVEKPINPSQKEASKRSRFVVSAQRKVKGLLQAVRSSA